MPDTNWLGVATDICLGRKPMPGISDAERLENLRDELTYAERNVIDAAIAADEAMLVHKEAKQKRTKALKAYVAHLEMMAAGVASK